jgi:outer membrane usher protein
LQPLGLDRLALAIVSSLALSGVALALFGISEAQASANSSAGRAAGFSTSADSSGDSSSSGGGSSETYASSGDRTRSDSTSTIVASSNGSEGGSGGSSIVSADTGGGGSLDIPSIGGSDNTGGSADIPSAGSDDAGGRMPEPDLYLEVWLGERPVGKIAHFKLRDGLLWSTPAELGDVGIVVDSRTTVDADGMLPLDRLPGLRYHYDVTNQRVVLEVPTAMRPNQILGYTQPAAVHADRGSGVVLGYDSYATHQNGQTGLAVATALRWFGKAGTLEQTGLSRAGTNATAYTRLDTRWTYSDPDRLWTWTAGDLITGGLSWTRPVRLGGIQWRRNFGVRPDLITYPIPTFASQATVPSTVELLVNNIQQFGTQVNDGPFVLDTFPRISGAGEATLVVRDALGRVTQTTVSIYTDHVRLAKGLTDFSVEAGVLRHDFGAEHDGYAHDPVFSGSLRRGLTDDFTLEAHAESGPHLGLAGLGLVWSPFGHLGLVSASAAHSAGDGQGWQRSVGYQWFSQQFGMDLQAQRASRGFRDLGSLDAAGAGPMLAQDRATFSMPVPRGSVSYTWVRWRDNKDHRSQVQTLSWTENFKKALYLTASVFHDQTSGTGAGVSLSMPLGRETTASLNLDHDRNGNNEVATVQRSVPYQGGWGWQLQAGDQHGDAVGTASASFRGNYGDASFGVSRVSGKESEFASASGSVAWMDGHLFASRHIGDSFAVISTGGVGGVPILYENRVYGLTDSHGYLMIPELRGWQRNRLAIDPDRLGANYRLSALEQFVTPADAGGTLVRFGVQKLQPAIAVLLGPDGKPVLAGTAGKVVGQNADVMVGFDGEAYVENAPAGTVIEMEVDGVSCHYHLPTFENSNTQARLGPLACDRSDR